MSTRPEGRPAEPEIDPAGLFLEEVFTDRRIGTIRRLTPVTPEGTPDASRPVTHIGETQVMSNVGAIPIVFEIEAATVGEAATKFGALAKEAIERTMREIQEMRRQQSSSLVIPGAGGMGGMGGMGGGGKIQLT
jgi:hypothetical protein